MLELMFENSIQRRSCAGFLGIVPTTGDAHHVAHRADGGAKAAVMGQSPERVMKPDPSRGRALIEAASRCPRLHASREARSGLRSS